MNFLTVRSLKRALFLFTSLLLIPFAFSSCIFDDDLEGEDKDAGGSTTNPPAAGLDGEIAKVYFAQTHVFEPEYLVPGLNERIKLISDREALLKVQVISTTENENAPAVEATLELPGKSPKTLTLTGPATLKTSFESALGKVQHRFDDSFTVTIPVDYMKPGLKVTIKAGDEQKVYDNLSFTAPHKIYFNNFLLNIFGTTEKKYSDGWIDEFKNNFPLADFEVQHIEVEFDEFSVPAIDAIPATKIKSLAEYTSKTGLSFDYHNSATIPLRNAFKRAAGIAPWNSAGHISYVNASWYYEGSNQTKGVSGGHASSVATRAGEGMLMHEMGHAFSLPHWADKSFYPYKGDMLGISQGPVSKGTHAGPIWGYNAKQQKFLKPTRDGVTPLTYKNDPMQGGAKGSPEPGFLLNHFSDYSIVRMISNYENNLIVYTGGKYAKWNPSTNSYSTIIENKGNVTFPIIRDVDVYTLAIFIDNVSPQANIVYPPIGAYKSGLIQVFDPRDAQDRADSEYFCKQFTDCDYTLRVTQGGKVKYLMMSIVNTTFGARAVNVPVSDGTVTKIELLETPKARINGLPTNPKVISTWEK